MKIKTSSKIWILSLATIFMANAQENKIEMKIPAKEIVINKNIYGHFAEHLGRLVYDGLYVGEDNTDIPNTDGVRNDIIAALKNLNIPVLRWPGLEPYVLSAPIAIP